MKNIKRLFFFMLVAAAILFYKEEISDHWLKYRGSEQESSFVAEMSRARDARQEGDFTLSLQ
jgi:hypothetical protein